MVIIIYGTNELIGLGTVKHQYSGVSMNIAKDWMQISINLTRKASFLTPLMKK